MSNLEIDGIKLDKDLVFGRIKGTEIWVELNPLNQDCLAKILSQEMLAAIHSWREALSSD